MPTTNELKEEANRDPVLSPNYVTVLYGDIGKRKTTTACSMVGERGLLLSTDDSWKVLLNERHEKLSSKIKITPVDAVSQFEYIDFEGYDTVIWDTASKSVDRYLDLLYDEGQWKSKDGRILYRDVIDSKHKDLKDVSVLAPMDYRVTRDVFRPVLDKLFNNTKAHIIITSQAKYPTPGLSKDSVIRPDIPPATFKVIGERADWIANIRPETRKFVVDMTENSMAYLAKSRIEGLQGKMDLDDFVTKYKEIAFK